MVPPRAPRATAPPVTATPRTNVPSASPSYEPWPFEESTWWPTWSPTTWAPTISSPPTLYIDYPFYFPNMAVENGNDDNDSQENPMMLAEMAATKEPEDDTITTATAGRSSQVELDGTGNVVKPHLDFFGTR